MYWCDKCQIWEHEKCLTNAIRKQFLKENRPTTNAKRPRKTKGNNIEITISAKDESGGVTAYIGKKQRTQRVPGDQDVPGEEDVDVKSGSLQEEDAVSTVVPVRCLKCGNVLT
jgi:hypothetical protein